jgi:hypothetical protein
VLSPQDQTIVREWLADIAAGDAAAVAERQRIAQLRCDILRMLRDRHGLTNDALGVLAGVSASRAGELARAGHPDRFTA